MKFLISYARGLSRQMTLLFIPKKRNKYEKKFGFARFKENADIAYLERDLNNCWIDLYKGRENNTQEIV